METLKELLDDIKEAERQDKFTHEARNWLVSFRKHVEKLINNQPVEPTDEKPCNCINGWPQTTGGCPKHGVVC